MKNLAYYLAYHCGVSPNDYQSRQEWEKEVQLEIEFRADLAKEYGVTKEAVDFAWEASHDYGLSAVVNTLEDLMIVIQAEKELSK